MAAPIIQQESASQFIGSPMVYRVVPTGGGFNSTFYRIVLTVNANMSGYADVHFEFSSQVDGMGGVLFDVSSALRACADQWQPSATNLSYPSVAFTLTASEEWMDNGALVQNPDKSISNGETAYMGALSDLERLIGTRPSRYSRKPTGTPELCFTHFQSLQPGPTSSSPITTPVTVSDGFPVGESANIYGIPAPRNGCELRFVNSLGVHENVFVSGLYQTEAKIETVRHNIAHFETISKFSRGLALKRSNREQWHFSSPPLDEQWQSWYVHELLTARWLWLGIPIRSTIDSNPSIYYVPCHILPEETTELINRQKPDALTVPIALEMDINGSPRL